MLVFVLEAGDHLGRHHLPHRRGVRILAFGGGANRDVAISKDAEQAIVLADRQHAAVQVAHRLGCFPQRRVGRGDDRVARHDLFDLHGYLLHPFARGREVGFSAA
jgi:hypothetical protein